MLEHAKQELSLLIDDDMQKALNQNVLDVLQVLDSQGHTSITASYVIHLVTKLWKGGILKPLTGNDNEWVQIGQKADYLEQNIRKSDVFRQKGKAYQVEHYSFCEPYDNNWFVCGEESNKNISFPCTNEELKHEYLRLWFPSEIVPIKWAKLLHLYSTKEVGD